jgi:hypothetical protein
MEVRGKEPSYVGTFMGVASLHNADRLFGEVTGDSGGE